VAKRYDVRVSDEWRFPTFRSAGREFSKVAPVIVHEGDPGSEEILSCAFLEATEIPAPEPEVEQPEVGEMEGEAGEATHESPLQNGGDRGAEE